ncbi:MAG TPA: archease [Actinomycetota bacterium]|nr:archease [Actinomycetota bacterium]
MGFEIIEHTADVGVEAWAATLEELFVEAARGLIAVMGRGTGPAELSRRVELSAPDVEALLVDWLSELVYAFEVHGVVAADGDVRIRRPVTQDADWVLEADVTGTDANAFEQEGAAVKAVTYHAIEVTEGASGARARVYLDV